MHAFAIIIIIIIYLEAKNYISKSVTSTLPVSCVFQTLYKTQVRELKEECEERNKLYKEMQQSLQELQEERWLIFFSMHFKMSITKFNSITRLNREIGISTLFTSLSRALVFCCDD